MFHTNSWKGSRVDFSNRYSSSLLRETAFKNNWQDENVLRFVWNVPLVNRLQTKSILQSQIFSDDNTRLQFNKNLLAQELSISLHPLIKFEPAVGWAIEETYGNRDQGLYTKLGFRVNKMDMGGYLNSTDIKSMILFFPGRQNQEHTIFTNWNKQFSSFARDSLNAGYQYTENRYFLPAGAGIEHVLIRASFVTNALQYRTSKNASLLVLTEFRNRDIDQSNPNFRNRRNELDFSNQFNYQIVSGPLSGMAGLVFSQIIHDNLDNITDIDALQTGFVSRLSYQPSRKDIFRSSFSYSKFEYNTPAEINIDDRDEQRFVFDGSYHHRFSSNFSTAIKGYLYMFHQIYVNAGKSQNNNWNKIYQLATNFDYRVGKWFGLLQEIKILANYTIFDFDEILPQARSYVFRRLAYTDSLSVKMTSNLTLRSMFRLEVEDNGTFFKQNFSQQVTREQNARYFNIALVYKSFMGFRITSGISFYWRDEWALRPRASRAGLINERIKTREFRSIWPRLSLSYTANRRLLFLATYAPNRSTNFGAERQYYTTGSVNLQYLF